MVYRNEADVLQQPALIFTSFNTKTPVGLNVFVRLSLLPNTHLVELAGKDSYKVKKLKFWLLSGLAVRLRGCFAKTAQ